VLLLLDRIYISLAKSKPKYMETLSSPKEVKAKIKHRCDFCENKININDTYLRSTHKHEGCIYTWRTHTYCSYIANRLNMYDDCDEGVTSDYFIEAISNEHYELLTRDIPEEAAKSLGDIFHQLQKVMFQDKLRYVIKYYNNQDKSN
jgi:hypothetical protein